MQVTKAILGVYKKRPATAHKGDFGTVLVIGGNKIYTGAPRLTALAALRAGADLSILAAPQRPADLAARQSADLITVPLKGDCLSPRHLPEIFERAQKADAVVIGPGLGREKATIRAVRAFLKKTSLPTVIDADAIRALDNPLRRTNIIYTPHANEFLSLFREKQALILAKRKAQVKRHANGFTILLKGHVDIISDGTKIATNTTGNPYMTKGGTGDVLAGVCSALLARGCDPFTAACAGAYINGKAGDLAGKKFGESLTATDVLSSIPAVIQNR